MIRAVPGERVHGGPRGSGRRIAVTLAAMGGGAALLAALWWANTPSGQGSAGRGLATARPPVETAAPAPPDPALEAFLAGLRPEAAAKGIGAASLERAFQGLRLDPQVGELAANQPEHVKPVGEYLALLVSPERIAAGSS